MQKKEKVKKFGKQLELNFRGDGNVTLRDPSTSSSNHTHRKPIKSPPARQKPKSSLPVSKPKPLASKEQHAVPTEAPKAAKPRRPRPPPLPKSELFSDKRFVARGASDSRLPPPDMKYHLKKARRPLKLSTKVICSSFVLPGNVVYFVGSRPSREDIRKKFLQCVRSGTFECDEAMMEEEEGLISSHSTREETAPQTNEGTNRESDYSRKTAIPVVQMIPSSGVASSTSSGSLLSGSRTEDVQQETASNNEYDTSMDFELFEDPQVLEDFMDAECSDSELMTDLEGGVDKAEAVQTAQEEGLGGFSGGFVGDEMSVLQDPKVLRNFIADDDNGSFSSDEDELPRVNITGLSSNKAAPISMDKQGSASSIPTEVERCPICNTGFPSGCSQLDADEHIAVCLHAKLNMD